MRKDLITLFVFSLFLISNCSSFQMLSEDDFDVDDPSKNGPTININEVGYNYYFDERGFREDELHIVNNTIANVSSTKTTYDTIKMGKTSLNYHPYTVFEISNTGNKTLELLLDPKIQISNNNFVLYEDPDDTVNSNNKTRFIIKLIAENNGFYQSLVSIYTNDPDNEVFRFYIQGEVGEMPRSKINVREVGYHVYPEYYGNVEETLSIENRENVISNVTPSMEYYTIDLGGISPDFPVYSVLEISNSGDAPLYLLNDTYIEIDNELFELYQTSDNAIEPGNTSKFIVKISTDQLGIHETLVTINTNDPDNMTFNFKMKISVQNH